MTTAAAIHISFDNSYARLPQNFFAKVEPTWVRAPRLIHVNDELANFLNIDPGQLHSQEGAEVFAGNCIATGSEPLAMAYAGHQFGGFVPQLGDGRACMLGEVVAQDDKRYDIQLKGSGPTPFSRQGDGRAALGPVLREYLVSEAMHRLHVPTTRALAAVLTGEAVLREEMLPGAVLTRVASSHLRVGTFEYFSARKDTTSLHTLANYAISRHYPEAVEQPKRYRALLEGVVRRQAALVAQWMGLGFIHGVMNTDNTSISGETIDYGPCAFMEAHDPATVFSAIDRQGRYAYGNQPKVMLWNLSRLGETLLPLMAEEEGSQEAALATAYEVLNSFAPLYEAAYLRIFRAKLGLAQEQEEDAALVKDLLEAMAEGRADFTLMFRHLSENDGFGAREQFAQPAGFEAWHGRWLARLTAERVTQEERNRAMQQTNPVYIPRNHLVQEVIDAALRQDFAPFEQLLAVLDKPFQERTVLQRFAAPAALEQRVLQTFCGT
ncbi:protein adenylyltransferase SelO [Terriglobus sp.]|uniref:protein adenylyltransferase SelO n=1 Tax=Terriglobus sp. TaxID=1889013 RepID=UPI003AFFB451